MQTHQELRPLVKGVMGRPLEEAGCPAAWRQAPSGCTRHTSPTGCSRTRGRCRRSDVASLLSLCWGGQPEAMQVQPVPAASGLARHLECLVHCSPGVASRALCQAFSVYFGSCAPITANSPGIDCGFVHFAVENVAISYHHHCVCCQLRQTIKIS